MTLFYFSLGESMKRELQKKCLSDISSAYHIHIWKVCLVFVLAGLLVGCDSEITLDKIEAPSFGEIHDGSASLEVKHLVSKNGRLLWDDEDDVVVITTSGDYCAESFLTWCSQEDLSIVAKHRFGNLLESIALVEKGGGDYKRGHRVAESFLYFRARGR